MKKEDKKVLLMTISIILIETLSYFLTKFTPFKPNLLQSELDSKLPLVESFVIFYFLWYVYLLCLPYLLYKKDKSKFFKYAAITLISIILAAIIFIFYPTTIIRGDLNLSNNIFGFLIKFIYFTDTPILNCLPSMHTVLSLIFIILISETKDIKISIKIALNISLLLIIASTLLIKQHVIVDIIAAIIIVILSIIINKIFKITEKIENLFIKIQL